DPPLPAWGLPARALRIKGAAAIIGIPVGADVEGDDRIAELRRVVAQGVVVALVPASEIDRAHPAAVAFKENVAPAIIGEAAENRNPRTVWHRDDHRKIGTGPRTEIDIGDGIAVG